MFGLSYVCMFAVFARDGINKVCPDDESVALLVQE